MATIKQYEKKDGTKAWMFQSYLGVDPITGKEKRTTRRGFKTQKEAKLALSRLQLEIDKNGFQSEYKVKTFQDLYEAWIEQYKNTIKVTTYESILRIFAIRILPKMGHWQLKKVTPVMCQKIINEWADKYKSVTLIRTYAKMVFKYGIRIGICDSDPFDKVITPKKGLEQTSPNTDSTFYTKSELKLFFEYLEQMKDIRWLTFFRTLAFTGARKGEVLALNWEDVDFKEQTITFNKTLVYINNRELKTQSPKTKASNRTISIDHETLAILKKWQIEQRTTRLALGLPKATGKDIVFSKLMPTLECNYLYLSHPGEKLKEMYRKFPELKKIKIHGFRHTHASLLFESGADIKVVQQRLGHSDIKTTMDIYTHVSSEHEKDTGLRFAKYVNF